MIKSKKKLIIIAGIACAIVIVGFVTAKLSVRLYDTYQASPEHQQKVIKDANTSVDKMFKAVSSGDTSKSSEYINISDVVSDDAKKYDLDLKGVFADISSDISFEEKSTTFVDSHNVIVKGTVTAPDISAVWGKAVRNNIKNNLLNLNKLSKDEQEKLLKESLSGEFDAALSEGTTDTKSTDVTIHYVRNGLKWSIQPDEELYDALLGGLYSAINTTEINK